jgi:hypothetical protein
MLKYGESPMATQVEPRWHDRIVHATLQLGELELTGVDVFPHDYHRPQGFFLTLTISELAKAKQIFLSLSEGGEIRLWRPHRSLRRALGDQLCASIQFVRRCLRRPEHFCHTWQAIVAAEAGL